MPVLPPSRPCLPRHADASSAPPAGKARHALAAMHWANHPRPAARLKRREQLERQHVVGLDAVQRRGVPAKRRGAFQHVRRWQGAWRRMHSARWLVLPSSGLLCTSCNVDPCGHRGSLRAGRAPPAADIPKQFSRRRAVPTAAAIRCCSSRVVRDALARLWVLDGLGLAAPPLSQVLQRGQPEAPCL